jgi:hypothetical protein
MKKVSWEMVVVGVLALAIALMPAVAGATVQARFAGAAAGDWSGKGKFVSGPVDGSCSNMGALGKINNVFSFGFSIPIADADIQGITVYVFGGTDGGQAVKLQLAENASTTPPLYGVFNLDRQMNLVADASSCTSVVNIEDGELAGWGSGLHPLYPDKVNSANFGVILTKIVNSSVKVDAVCVEIEYDWNGASEEPDPGRTSCTAVPEFQPLVVTKVVGGPAPGSDWAYTGTNGITIPNIPAIGGSQEIEVENGKNYTVTETTKANYELSVECTQNRISIGSPATDGVTLTSINVSEFPIICTFTNTKLGSLTVIKEVVGEAPGEAWKFDSTGLTSTISDFPAGGGTKQFDIIANNSITITETPKAGYALSIECKRGEADVDIGTTPNTAAFTALENDNVVCTFTNTKLGTLTVVKQVNGDAPGSDWVFGATGGLSPTSFTLPAAGGSKVYNDVGEGYIITETTKTGYSATVECWKNDDAEPFEEGTDQAEVEFMKDDIVVCYFVNTEEQEPLPVPTLNQWGLILLSTLIIGSAVFTIRRHLYNR